MNSVRRSGVKQPLCAVLWAISAWVFLWSGVSQAEDPDPVSRVARVSYLKGQVSVQTSDDDGWATAGINQPLTSGDQLSTDNRGRAELQMGNTSIQIDENTQLRLLEVSDDVLQLQVTQGVVNVRVRNLGDNDTVEIDTPNAAVTAHEAGTYRIDVADRDDQTIVQVRQGSVDVAGEKQSFTLRSDEQLTLRGSSRLSAEFDQVARLDEFDRWADERNRRAARVASSRYVGADVIGYEDLDDYGYWRWYSDYGYVWMPTRVVSGWAPYRYGHWTWVSPWGWTWIDDAPWGFAPFHYGRWATVDRRWCWVPGPRTARAVYAPALVAWIGTPGVSVSVNLGAQPVGWIPLGPREVYRPFYRSSRDYIVNVNLSNSLLNHDQFERGYRRQPHDIQYGNRNAASVVPANTLREARAVNRHLVTSNSGGLQAVADAPVGRPERNVNLINQRRVTPPANVNAREVVARRQPVMPTQSDTGSANSKPNNVRVIQPNVVRRFDNDNRADNRSNDRRDNRAGDNTSGRGVNVAPNSNGGDTSRGQRELNSNNPVKPDNRGTRSIITTPAIRPETKGSQRADQPLATPDTSTETAPAPSPAPKAIEPRERNRSGGRDAARPGERELRGAATGSAVPVRERERSVAVRSRPAPQPQQQRSEPPQQAVPASAATPTNNSRRSENKGDQNGLRRGRQDSDAR